MVIAAIWVRKSAAFLAALLFTHASTVAARGSEETPAELARRPLATRASLWRCDPTVKFACSAGGCKSVAAEVWVQLDLQTPAKYERCDAKGCDAYEISPAEGGIYTSVAPKPGSFLKALNDGSDFVEVISAGTSVFISYGQCAPMATKRR